MNIDFGAIFAAVDLAQAERVERLDEFELSVGGELTQAQAHVIALALLQIGPTLPGRDRFEVMIEIDGETTSVCDDSEESRAKLGKLFDLGSAASSEVNFRVTIRKEVQNNALSIYDLDAFGRYLASEPLKRVLDAIAARLKTHLTLVCTGLLQAGGSATLQFVPGENSGSAMVPLEANARQRTIALFKETSFSASLPATLIPLDFQLVSPVGQVAIDAFFARASSVLSAAYLSNNAELELDGAFTYRMAGYKVLEERCATVDALAGSHEVLSKIANWAYDAGGSTDKVGLARNVLSLHVSSLRDLAAQPQVFSAILSNYQIYLKDNVSAYLDVRNRMAELLLESTSKTHGLVESLLESVRNGILVIFTFVLTVVVINGLKDTNTRLIFSGEYVWIVIIIATLCSVWIYHACKDVVARFDHARDTTRQLLRDSYRHVLIEDEVDQHTEATFLTNRSLLMGQVRKYKRLWYLVSVILVLGFLVGFFATHQLPRGNEFEPNMVSSPATSESAPTASAKDKGEDLGDPPATMTPSNADVRDPPTQQLDALPQE